MPSRNNYVCHVCWMQAKRQALHDSSRNLQELASDNDAADPNVQVLSQPEAPPLPPVQRGPLNRESNTISECYIWSRNFLKLCFCYNVVSMFLAAVECVKHICRGISGI